MKTMKKALACILVVMMFIAMSVSAFAVDEAKTYTITVKGTATEHTYEAYQIFSGVLDGSGKLTEVKWGSGIDSTKIVDGKNVLQALQTLERYQYTTDAKSVAQALNNGSSADGLDFAAVISNYLSETHTSSSASGTTYTIGPLSAGYYLIKDKDNSLVGKTDVSYTEFIMTLSKDTIVNPKSGHPNIYKKVSETGVAGTYDEWVTQSIGSKVHFDIRGTLSSELHYYDTYYYAFHDTMSQGLSFDGIESVSVSRIDADGHENVIDSSCYDVSVDNKDNMTYLTVTFNDLLSATSKNQSLEYNRSDMIRLHYTATLNEHAQIGIENPDKNKVKLEYSNNPNTNDRGFTHDVDVDVYTFGLEILKVDAMENTKALAGAKFILYRTISGVTTYAKATLPEGVERPENGTYKISGWVSKESDATQFITGNDGKVLVSGVKAGGFYVKEVSPPSGYNILQEPLEVWIHVEGGKLNSGDASDDVTASVGNALVVVNPSTGIVSATIENASGTVLPSTGGIGTTIFYVIGGVLVLAAVVLMVTRKRMDEEA